MKHHPDPTTAPVLENNDGGVGWDVQVVAQTHVLRGGPRHGPVVNRHVDRGKGVLEPIEKVARPRVSIVSTMTHCVAPAHHRYEDRFSMRQLSGGQRGEVGECSGAWEGAVGCIDDRQR